MRAIWHRLVHFVKKVAFVLILVIGVALLPFRFTAAIQQGRELYHMAANGLTELFRGGGVKREPYAELPHVSDERAAALYFRPLLYFDTSEMWRPMRLDTLFAEGSHRVCLGDQCDQMSSLRDLYAAPIARKAASEGRTKELYIDIAGHSSHGYGSFKCLHFPSRFECDGAPDTAIYAHHIRRAGMDYWDYWWFFRFNDYTVPTGCRFGGLCFDHEGDWEGMTVVTKDGHVVEAHYAEHEGKPVNISGSQLELEGALYGDQVVVDLAQGTHAAYWTQCSHGESQEGCPQNHRTRPESSHDGEVAWFMNSDGHCANQCVIMMSGAPGSWALWPGRWGHREHAYGASPRSPGEQARFRAPWNSR